MVNMIVGGTVFVVTPEELNAKAEEVHYCVEKMKTHFAQLKEIVDKSAGYWIGEGGDIHRKIYNEYIEEINNVLKRFAEHPRDLNKISSVYKQAEQAAQDIPNELPGNVL